MVLRCASPYQSPQRFTSRTHRFCDFMISTEFEQIILWRRKYIDDNKYFYGDCTYIFDETLDQTLIICVRL